jgi:eukaryotic-like serine/threonine-protein kinase
VIGRRLSHYRILERLGEGGMGVVYRAHDEHLDRDVAVKVLAPGTLANDDARRRFRREALALSRLQHPHILTVFDFDRHDGVDFLVMELVPGTNLAARLHDGKLPESEVLRLGVQVAEALEAAHEQGIIHRDLKPSNVMITPRGEAKVLDFGLAKRFGPPNAIALTGTLTDEQATVGTMPYMAPEQLLGREVDGRTDLYALGTLLYELATGHRPFEETQSFALASQILNQAPTPLRERCAGLSTALDEIVLRCLAKDPAARFSSAHELAEALKGHDATAWPTTPPAPAPAGRAAAAGHRGAWASVTLVAAVLVVLGGSLLVTRLPACRPAGRHAIQSLAVLPLVNLSGDPQQEYFADGMTDELITSLSQIAALRIISRTSVMRFKGTSLALPDIARRLHVDGVIEGSVMRSGSRVRIAAELIEATSDRHLWADRYEREVGDVLALQNEVARAVAERIRVTLSPTEQARLARIRTVTPSAHEAYLRGLYCANQYTVDGFREAVTDFQRAIAADPTYAPAYAGLALAYAGTSSWAVPAAEAMPRARAAALKAIELDSTLASGHAWLGEVEAFYDWDWKAGEREIRKAIELNPSDPDAHLTYGYLLVVNRRFAEAERELKRAREIDPLSETIASVSLFPLYESRRYDEAAAAATQLIESSPDLPIPHQVLGQARLMKGDSVRALPEFRRALELEPSNPLLVGFLGNAYAATGNRAAALALLDTLRMRATRGYVQPYAYAVIYAGLRDHERTFHWLEQCIALRSEEIVFLQVDPAMDAMRPDPRFAPLLRRVGFGG